MASFTTFAQVQNALQTFVTTNSINIPNDYHVNFWEQGSNEDEQYNYFITAKVFPGNENPIIKPYHGDESYIILALRGKPPFDGTLYAQMPEGGPYLVDATIDAIAAWITAGAKQNG